MGEASQDLVGDRWQIIRGTREMMLSVTEARGSTRLMVIITEVFF
jgi:hypothetical protein